VASLINVVFDSNRILADRDAGAIAEPNYGPDLFIGQNSSALLDRVTFTALTADELRRATPAQRARISVRDASAKVYSRSAGSADKGGLEGARQEIEAPVYIKDGQQLTTTQPVPAGIVAVFPSLSDPWYSYTMRVASLRNYPTSWHCKCFTCSFCTNEHEKVSVRD
jgi:hypothetical protein